MTIPAERAENGAEADGGVIDAGSTTRNKFQVGTYTSQLCKWTCVSICFGLNDFNHIEQSKQALKATYEGMDGYWNASILLALPAIFTAW